MEGLRVVLVGVFTQPRPGAVAGGDLRRAGVGDVERRHAGLIARPAGKYLPGADNALWYRHLYLRGYHAAQTYDGRRSLLLGEALPANRWLTVGAVGLVLFCLWLRLGWYGFVPGGAPLPDLEVLWNKNDLAPVRLAHALALAWLVSCWVPRDRPWMHGLAGRWLSMAGKIGRASCRERVSSPV